jgi:thioredoxin reductase (NADPH)
MQQEVFNLLILGSGPAGLTAAIYAARAGLSPLIIEGTKPGGQPMATNVIENFPGFPKGVTGHELIARMREQAERFGAHFLSGEAGAINFKKEPFSVTVGKVKYLARSVVVATGASPRWLGVPGEDKFRGRGVSVCATCDGFFFRDKVVAVVGGGDTALEQAISLTRFAKKIIVIHRRDKLRASRAMQQRAKGEEKIEFYWNKIVESVNGEKTVEGLTLRDAVTNENSELVCQGVFIAIGHEPSTKIFQDQLDLDERGYLKTKNIVATNIEGVFAAGDVADHNFRQAITAAATGAMAAMKAEEFLQSLKY